ncbi:MAG: hypothetical protein ABR928_15500 [Terracidiphilus sp.]|jgi:hypothetical protein
MAQQTQADQQRKLDEDEEQATAKDEPFGSVAAAVPRDAGSAVTHNADCKEDSAPPHKGGPATLVAGKEAHQADKPQQKKAEKNNH